MRQLYYFLFILLLGSLSAHTFARDDHQHLSGRIFYSYESNGLDYLSSVGVGTTVYQGDSGLGFQLNTSIGRAEVIATDGYLEEYVSWEGSVRFGLFSNVSIYVEGGIDLAEALFHDLRYDDYDYEYGYEDDIDAYVGMGAGIKFGALDVSSFVRLREIDSRYWEAESEVFSGIQFGLNF